MMTLMIMKILQNLFLYFDINAVNKKCFRPNNATFLCNYNSLLNSQIKQLQKVYNYLEHIYLRMLPPIPFG